MYDALESDVHNNGLNESRYAENDYFHKAVCLNAKGKIQAKAIGESLKHIGLPIGAVHSSVSCRARQTAELVFGDMTNCTVYSCTEVLTMKIQKHISKN